MDYLTSVPGNALYAAIFGLLICINVFLGVRYRTTGYLIGTFFGLLGELIGYIGRILMHSNPFVDAHFVMYLCCLTIAPAFLTASIYLCISRIVVIYSEAAARFRPRTYTFFFVFCDVVSLVLQGAGGGVAATATTSSQSSTGKSLLVAGLAFQVASLTVFAVACLDLLFLYRNSTDDALNPAFGKLRSSFKFRAFLWSLSGATFFIYVRSCFRIAELSSGFHSKLANSQITFMILEGMMIVLASLLLTIGHPGWIMSRETWAAADWNARKSEDDASQEKADEQVMEPTA